MRESKIKPLLINALSLWSNTIVGYGRIVICYIIMNEYILTIMNEYIR